MRIEFSTKKICYFFFLIAFTAIFNLSAFAKGGGGGGGGGSGGLPPACEKDTWSCSSWSECSADGQETRTCDLAFDCTTTDTPKPPESRSCTPPCTQDTWTCGDWHACSSAGKQARNCDLTFDCPNADTPEPSTRQECTAPVSVVPAPVIDSNEAAAAPANNSENQQQSKPAQAPAAIPATPPTPQCTEDEYDCKDWGVCELDGRQRRSCNMKKDCPAAQSAIPEQERLCPGLKCNQLDTMEERIRCRVQLTDAEETKEYQILYAPEYCKIEESAQERSQCLNLYWAFETCWAMPAGPERQQCGIQKARYTNFKEDAATCKTKTGTEQEECKADLKERVENYLLFEMYELSFLAEDLLEQGRVSLDDVVALDTFVENQKAKLEADESIKAWKQILQETQSGWNDFINTKVK